MAIYFFLIFIFFALYCRTLIQYAITKDSGWRIVTPQANLKEKLAGFLVLFSFFLLFVTSYLEFKAVIIPRQSGIEALQAFGFVFCMIGIVVVVISQLQMGNNWRIGVNPIEQTDLVTNGLYAYIRNPIYTGMLIFAVGIFFLVYHELVFSILVLCYLSIEMLVREVEEPYLQKMHRRNYQGYCERTGRYLPKVNYLFNVDQDEFA